MIESGAGAGVVQTYKLNSAYDVDDSVGSTATAGFAEWAAFYAAYRVWSTSVKIEGVLTGGTTGSMGIVTLYPNATSVFLVGSGQTAPMSVRKISRADAVNGGPNRISMVKRFDLPTVLRFTKSQYNNDQDFAASVTASPSRLVRFGVGTLGVGSTVAVQFTYAIWVEMMIEFFNPVQLFQ